VADEIQDSLESAARASATDGIGGVVGAATELRARLAAMRTGSAPTRFRLEDIADAAAAEVARCAAELGVHVTAEVACAPGGYVPIRFAGPVLDALGTIVSGGVRHECARGGAVRIALRPESDGFTIAVGNRGNAESRELDTGEAERLDLAAASSRLTALGCEMNVAGAPWGGTSVTVRVQTAADRQQRRRG